MEKQKITDANRISIRLNDGNNKEIEAKNIVIATGSIPTSIPGVEITGNKIISSTEALSLNEVPNKLRCCWRWIYRFRARFCLVKVRF